MWEYKGLDSWGLDSNEVLCWKLHKIEDHLMQLAMRSDTNEILRNMERRMDEVGGNKSFATHCKQ